MLVAKLLEVVMGFFSWVLSLFPVASIDTSWFSQMGSWFGSAMLLDSYLPIHEILACLVIWGGVYGAMHSGNLVRRIWSLFTGGGGA